MIIEYDLIMIKIIFIIFDYVIVMGVWFYWLECSLCSFYDGIFLLINLEIIVVFNIFKVFLLVNDFGVLN